MMNFLLQPGKAWARQVGEAFLAGCAGGVVVRPGETLPPGPVAMYGVTPETFDHWRQVLAEGRTFYYIDNAYFKPGHGPGSYQRITRNALQHDGHGTASPVDILALKTKYGIETIADWRQGGRHVLVCTQTEWWYVRHGTNLNLWVEGVCNQIRRHSDRPIRLRMKPRAKLTQEPNTVLITDIERPDNTVPLADDLTDCWAVVVHSSNVAVEAILAGVPAFVTSHGPGLTMGCQDLKFIEDPFYPNGVERANWAAVLGRNQWSFEEIAAGAAWRELHED